MSLSSDQIKSVCRLTEKITGIQWDQSKDYLIETRINNRLGDFGCKTLDELLRRVESGDVTARNAFIDAVTTRETSFFRDESPYIALENKALPELIDAKANSYYPHKLRLWSAAASSGQEAYSLVITLMEMLPDFDNWDIQVLATDISDAALATASRGYYSDFEIGRGMRKDLLDRYFTRTGSGWTVNENVRSCVSFQKRNLLEPVVGLGPFDIIFCRYVAIYFDLPVRRELFERLSKVLTPDGCIFVGSSENLAEYGPKWAPQFHCRAVFYQPNRPRAGFSLQPQHPLASTASAPQPSAAKAAPASQPVFAR